MKVQKDIIFEESIHFRLTSQNNLPQFILFNIKQTIKINTFKQLSNLLKSLKLTYEKFLQISFGISTSFAHLPRPLLSSVDFEVSRLLSIWLLSFIAFLLFFKSYVPYILIVSLSSIR